MEKEKCCHCSQRKKERSPEEYKKLIHRLNRIEGQIRGIKGMVENDAYCPDILFLLYEIIARRKPSDKFMEYAQMVGMFLLFALLIWANFNDIMRFLF